MHSGIKLGVVECFGLTPSGDQGQSYNLVFDTLDNGFSVVQNGIGGMEWSYQDPDTLVGRSQVTGQTCVLVNPTPEFWSQHALIGEMLAYALADLSDR